MATIRTLQRNAPLILAVALMGGGGAVAAQSAERPAPGLDAKDAKVNAGGQNRGSSGVAGRVIGGPSPAANAIRPAGNWSGGNGASGAGAASGTPLASVGVYAYQLADLTLHRVITDGQGNFLFQDLPAGLYKVIAHKAGFEPAVIMLTRTTAQAYQFLELQLARQDAVHGLSGDDFWSLRARVPGDVLREIEASERPQISQLPRVGDFASLPVAALAKFHTTMQATTGVDQLLQIGASQVATGRLGIEGNVGDVQVGLRGRFSQVNASGFEPHSGSAADGQTSALSLDLQAGPGSRISLTSTNNHFMPRTDSGFSPVDFEHYGVAWSQALGDASHSELIAQYTSENNFNRQSPIDPADIPGASRTWRVEGSYTTSWSDSSTLQAGVRYREQQFGLVPSAAGGSLGPGLQQVVSNAGGSPGLQQVPQLAQTFQDNLDVFGRGGTRIQPAVLLEYGLYSTLRDGTVALTPQGGLVLELSEGWQLHTTVSHRAYESARINPLFLPTLFKEEDICEQGAKSCYQGDLSLHFGDDGTISFGAVQRSIGDTLRLYFSEEFFDRLESLYLVPGDRLPEVRFSITERLAPQVTTKLETNVAAGGGGTFAASDGQPYRNKVRYLVTSLDTRFQATGTGVFLALHRMRQDLAPIGAGSTIGNQFDRVQLMLTQDLNKRFHLAAEWALQLNMELSRDAAPFLTGIDRELHRRVIGGLAVKF
jgi:hypothetical protein